MGTVPSLNIPFVGRSDEYQALIKLFHKVKNGTTQVVVVSGEQGIGKTRLTDEFLNWAALENADILRSRTYETGVCLPYQPIIDALRKRLEIENAPEDLLDDAWLVELTTILPELRERYPDLTAVPCDEITARSRLFEAINRLGQSLSNRRPLVVLLDDLQWADPGTLELLHYLAQNWHSNRNPIMLLLLIRGESHPPRSAMGGWMEDLIRAIPITRLSLGPLEVSDVQQLDQSFTGAES